ncbi:hypothetical protein J31TS4_25890 [Paenibacillus sp. J31TS4]|uniref:YciI family protein n=1 Tax=Paenibacillus sp. J31TS4 TaxID=2807195 RepID=UPI001B1ABE6C|nr:YciI family protein [Paenibacillus sp. J31TS4]GIP39309.1 hypothetical protein J31TS4_25890 [Paenibacillus sp. J31TS4]
MRYILLVRATAGSEARVPYGPDFHLAREAYLSAMEEAGVLLAAEKLQPSSNGLRLVYHDQGGSPEREIGPFALDQAFLSEYILFEAETDEEAAAWASRLPLPGECGQPEIELRKLEEPTSGCDSRSLVLERELTSQLHMLRNH